MRWAEDVACMGEVRTAYSILVGKPEWKRCPEDLNVNRKNILEKVLRK
jgi:hypothetical protein